MKKITSLLSLLLIIGSNSFGFSQENSPTEVVFCESFHISRPVLEINAENPVNMRKIEKAHAKKLKESKDKKHRTPQQFVYNTEENGLTYGNDSSSIQWSDGSRNTTNKAPIQNWLGQTASGFRPMDPSGAAGPNHYIQAINSTTYKIYNKNTGATITTTVLPTDGLLLNLAQREIKFTSRFLQQTIQQVLITRILLPRPNFLTI